MIEYPVDVLATVGRAVQTLSGWRSPDGLVAAVAGHPAVWLVGAAALVGASMLARMTVPPRDEGDWSFVEGSAA